MNRKSVWFAAASLATAATLIGGGNVASANPPHAQTVAVSAMPAQWAALATSSTPKQVVLDSATGKVLSVTATTSSMTPATITVHNPCQSGDACWVHNAIPYADFGFAGTGTKTGTWQQRNAMYTHSHSTSVCWAESPNCSPRLGPNSVIAFNSYPVTGTKVTNYT